MELTEAQFRDYEIHNPYMYHNHIEICTFDAAGCVVKVELKPESMNLHGHVHGGLLCSMADCVSGLTARAGGGDYVTQSCHFNFLSNVTAGTIYAKAEPVKRGRRICIFHVTITSDKGKLMADGVVDMFRVD